MTQLDSCHPAEQFYQAVRQLIRLHMQHARTHSNSKRAFPRASYRNEYKTLRVTAARGMGHTYTALQLLQELPNSLLVTHNDQRRSQLVKDTPYLAAQIHSIDAFYQVTAGRSLPADTLKSAIVPVFIVDTVQLLERRDSKFDKLEQIVDTFDRCFDVKLFLYLE